MKNGIPSKCIVNGINMKNIHNVVSVLEDMYPQYTMIVNCQNPNYMVWFQDKLNADKFMEVELIINEAEESVVTSLLTNNNFTIQEYTELLDTFMRKFD
jgi:hypothetical protein